MTTITDRSLRERTTRDHTEAAPIRYNFGMSDEAALLAAIIAHPDEDAPRLIYADWLQENGQPERAEFIRVQTERERLTPNDPQYSPLARREVFLLGRHRRTWTATFDALLPEAALRFARGFVEQVTTPAPALLARAPEIWSLAPLRQVRITQSADCVLELSCLAHPPSLRLTAHLRPDDGAAQAEFDLLSAGTTRLEPWLQRGRWLVLCWPTDSNEGRRALTRFSSTVQRRVYAISGGDSYSFASRPLGGNEVSPGWCSAPLSCDEPTWLLFRDGLELAHQIGGTRLDTLSDAFWDPAGGRPGFAS
jgi:uncharacterized protein (TIGR02996 family)